MEEDIKPNKTPFWNTLTAKIVALSVLLASLTSIGEFIEKKYDYFYALTHPEKGCRDIFDSNSNKVRIAILQFNQYSNSRLEVDKIIKNRLSEIDKSVTVKFIQNCENLVDLKPDSIAKKLGADILIYGDYFDNSNKDRISINVLSLGHFITDEGIFKGKSKIITDISRLKEGYLQEEIDFLVFSALANKEYFWERLSSAKIWYKKAIDIFEKRKIIRSNDAMAIIYFQAGTCFQKVDNDDKKAIEYYKKATTYWNDFYQAYFNIANLLVGKRYKLADFYLSKALKVHNNDPELFVLFAVNYDSNKNIKKAGISLERSVFLLDSLNKVGIHVNQSRVWETYGDVKWNLQEFGLAKTYYLKAIENGYKETPSNTYRIGAVSMIEKDLPMAQKYLEKSMSLDSNSAISNVTLAFCYQNQGIKFNEAKKLYYKALKLDTRLKSKDLENDIRLGWKN